MMNFGHDKFVGCVRHSRVDVAQALDSSIWILGERYVLDIF